MATIAASENEFPKVLLAEGAAAATPGTGLVVVYAKSDGKVYSKDDAGTETELAAASAALAAHLADTADAHDASSISVLDSGAHFTATDVEAALAELFAAIAGGGIAATLADNAGDMLVASAADTWAKLATPTVNGQALQRVSGSPAWALPPGYELHHSQQTGAAVAITSTSSASPTSIIAGSSVTYDGGAVWITYSDPDFLINSATVDRLGLCGIYLDGSLIKNIGLVSTQVSNRTNRYSISTNFRYTPSAGSHTISVGGWKQNSGDTVQANGIADIVTLRITKV